jgi:HPt (histidine-containing phosphotransfer) domain-containing protein
MTPVLFVEALSLPPRRSGVLAHDCAAPGSAMAVIVDQPAIAPERFDELLSVIGPAGRAEFLECLTTDLNEAAGSLDRAIAQEDDSAARHWGHALIGLAGTLGALRLHDLARDLNDGLANGRLRGARRRLPELRAEIDRLIRFCRHAAGPEQVA